MYNFDIFFYSILLIIIFSIFFLKFNNKISNYLNLVDKPDNFRKRQLKNIPLTGGLYIYCILLIIYLCINKFDFYNDQFIQLNQFYFLTLIFFLGLVDDKIDINANIKIVSIYTLFLFYLYLEPSSLLNFLIVKELQLNINIMSISYFFTALCLLIFLNASNMFDGIDGQTGGYFLFLLLYLQYLNGFNLFLSLISISLLIFLIFNLYQKWYLGDSGVYLISFFISISIINNYHFENLSVEQIFLLMMVPGLDLIRLFFERIKRGKHPFSSDESHFHHLLLKKYNKKITLLISLSLVMIPNILAIYFDKFFVFIIVTLVIYLYLVKFTNKQTRKWI